MSDLDQPTPASESPEDPFRDTLIQQLERGDFRTVEGTEYIAFVSGEGGIRASEMVDHLRRNTRAGQIFLTISKIKATHIS